MYSLLKKVVFLYKVKSDLSRLGQSVRFIFPIIHHMTYMSKSQKTQITYEQKKMLKRDLPCLRIAPLRPKMPRLM